MRRPIREREVRAWWWNLRNSSRWILYCEYPLHHRGAVDVHYVHQEEGSYTTKLAVEGLEVRGLSAIVILVRIYV